MSGIAERIINAISERERQVSLSKQKREQDKELKRAEKQAKLNQILDRSIVLANQLDIESLFEELNSNHLHGQGKIIRQKGIFKNTHKGSTNLPNDLQEDWSYDCYTAAFTVALLWKHTGLTIEIGGENTLNIRIRRASSLPTPHLCVHEFANLENIKIEKREDVGTIKEKVENIIVDLMTD